MSTHNGHKNGVNPHDLIAARIVAQAIPSDKMPPEARKTVRAALTAVGEAPPPGKEDLTPTAVAAAAAVRETGAQHSDDVLLEIARQAGERVALQHDGILLALVRERLAEPVELEPLRGRLNGFDYPDGSRDYELDGLPLVTFWPAEVGMEDGHLLVNQRYRISV